MTDCFFYIGTFLLKRTILKLHNLLNQYLSKHQEVRFTPVMKVKKVIVVFLDLLGAIKWSLIIWLIWFIWTIGEWCISSNEWEMNDSKTWLKSYFCHFSAAQNKKKKKSRIRETPNLSTDADSSTAAKKLLRLYFSIFFLPNPNFFL